MTVKDTLVSGCMVTDAGLSTMGSTAAVISMVASRLPPTASVTWMVAASGEGPAV